MPLDIQTLLSGISQGGAAALAGQRERQQAEREETERERQAKIEERERAEAQKDRELKRLLTQAQIAEAMQPKAPEIRASVDGLTQTFSNEADAIAFRDRARVPDTPKDANDQAFSSGGVMWVRDPVTNQVKPLLNPVTGEQFSADESFEAVLARMLAGRLEGN